MNKFASVRRQAQPTEEGFTLLLVIFLVALLTIALAVALPRISKEIQRDRELETMERGKQYIRAVRLYYKKFGAYPPNANALVKPTNNLRFLRKKYSDPTTGKEDWKPVMFGQNKAPTAMGFFGQPLSGASTVGTGSSGLQSDSSTAQTDSSSQSAQQNSSSATASSSASSQTDLTGKTFGGAGIIGFSPNSPKQSIMVYKKKNHYNEWEFVYDPISEQMTGGNTGTTGQSVSSTSTPIGGTSSTGSTTSQ
jgi:type II secretory pathway pseudopilin PulG